MNSFSRSSTFVPPKRPCSPRYKIRIRGENPNHHLWKNHGTWFVYYTVYPTAATKERVRRSLGTTDLQMARTLRDRFFSELNGAISTVYAEPIAS